jgi:uncharacterized membrane protein YhaH (DUF805 family)
MEQQASNPYRAPSAPVSDGMYGAEGVKLSLTEIWFSFQGRLSRKPYWIQAGIPLTVANLLIFYIRFGLHANAFGALLSLLLLWPALAIAAKRFHDRDKSAWWLLILLIPVIGALWIIIELPFFRGTEGENRFGGDPTELY